MDALLDFVAANLDADETELFGETTPRQPMTDDDLILSSEDWNHIVFGRKRTATPEYRATIQARRRALSYHEHWCDGDCMGALGPDPSYYEAVRIVACAYADRPGFQARWRVARRSGDRAPGRSSNAG
ncbi:hypothetical protein J7E91_19060 [Streptomyces sp. ISL-99]|uniref:DUF6221 family protein n=1 Tax=Streptomyces sp. ISL-99 TaxID=2819193 RepID=UPI001BE6BC9D|nr:DUF6221 family protein [Streptomyces sp. ISL-99]MBT2527467.1 hypothetical protein [Streptomyces sp. ISL-99]